MSKYVRFFVLVFLVIAVNYAEAQCPPAGTYNSNTNLAFGDDSNDETCNVAGSLNTPNNKAPDVLLTNNGRFVIGEGNVGSATRTVVGNFTLDGNSIVNLNTGDSLIIWGNFTMNGNGDITMTNGTLYVYGSMTITDNATFGAGGNVIIRENFTVSGSNSDVTVGGGFSVGGTADLGSENIAVEDGAVFSASDLISTGTLTIDNGGTVFVENTIDDGITVTNNNTGGDTDCTNNCCGSLCDPATDELTPEGNAVLPIKLSNFEVNQEENAVILQWSTVSEDNFSHFEIYRYVGTERELIAEVSSTFNPSGDDYFLSDEKPSLGLNIYQIRSVDFDGYTEWFPAATIVFQPKDVSFKLYPNSARPEELVTDIYEDFGLEVYNLAGRMILTTTVSGKDLSALGGLEKGSYIFRYNINSYLETQRMIIR